MLVAERARHAGVEAEAAAKEAELLERVRRGGGSSKEAISKREAAEAAMAAAEAAKAAAEAAKVAMASELSGLRRRWRR